MPFGSDPGGGRLLRPGLHGPEVADGFGKAGEGDRQGQDGGVLVASRLGQQAERRCRQAAVARRLWQVRWCAQWWLHAEAIVRLEALWRSWETLRLDPNGGMATWLRDHLDPQRTVLVGEPGPFQACEGGEHNSPPELPVIPVPAGYWPNRETEVE